MTIVEKAAHGCQVKIGNGATSEVFNILEGVFNGPGGLGWVPQIIQAFHHASSTIKKYPTSVDTGEVTFSLYYDSSDTYHAQLRAAAQNKTQTNFQIVFTDQGAEQAAFAAFVSFEYDADPENWNMANITLSINGDITIT